MRLAPLLSLLLLLGCDDEPTVAPEPPATPVTPVTPVTPPGPVVPTLTNAWTEVVPTGPTLVVAHDIRIEDSDPIITFDEGRVRADDKEGGETGFLITALHSALSDRPAGEVIVLAVRGEIPFQTLADVIYTMGQARHATFALLVQQDGGVGSLPVMLSSPGPQGQVERMLLEALEPGGSVAEALAESESIVDTAHRPDDGAPLRLQITVTADGMIVSGSGGNLAPGCEEVRPGRVVTVPRREGTQDLAGLTRCLRVLRTQFENEDRVIITADSEILFDDLVRIIAAARGTQSAPLFPRTFLGAGMR